MLVKIQNVAIPKENNLAICNKTMYLFTPWPSNLILAIIPKICFQKQQKKTHIFTRLHIVALFVIGCTENCLIFWYINAMECYKAIRKNKKMKKICMNLHEMQN